MRKWIAGFLVAALIAFAPSATAQLGHEMMTNKSGGALVVGSVVVVDPANAAGFTTTTTASSKKVAGVVAETSIANNATGLLMSVGSYTSTIRVTGAVAVGDYLITSTTAGRAASNASDGLAAFAIATTANASGLGTVEGILLNPEGQLASSANETITGAWTFSTAPTLTTALFGNATSANRTQSGATVTSDISQSSDTQNQYASSFLKFSTSTTGAISTFGHARGTKASPLVVASGDDLGGNRFEGYDGTDWEVASRVFAQVDGTPGSNDMPGRLVFYTTPDGSATPAERMRITNAGLVGIAMTPARTLDVTGTFGATGAATFGSTLSAGATTATTLALSGTITSTAGASFTQTGLVITTSDTSGADTVFTRTMPGLNLSVGSLNTSAKYGFALKWMSTDSDLTTENPKLLALITSYGTENFNADTRSGTGLAFATSPDTAGTTNLPLERMLIDQNGNVGIAMTPVRKLDVTGTFGATGAATFGSTVATGALTVTGAATVSTTLGVTGAASFSSTGVFGGTTHSGGLGNVESRGGFSGFANSGDAFPVWDLASKSRGTYASPTAVLDEDALWGKWVYGYSNSAYQLAAISAASVDVAPSGSVVQTRWSQSNQNVSGVLISRAETGAFKVLTDATLVSLVSATLASGSVACFQLEYGVEVTDGTDYQTETGRYSIVMRNKAGAITATATKFGDSQTASAGTLTVTVTPTAASPSVIQMNADTSLTPSANYPRVTYTIHNMSQQAMTIQ